MQNKCLEDFYPSQGFMNSTSQRLRRDSLSTIGKYSARNAKARTRRSRLTLARYSSIGSASAVTNKYAQKIS